MFGSFISNSNVLPNARKILVFLVKKCALQIEYCLTTGETKIYSTRRKKKESQRRLQRNNRYRSGESRNTNIYRCERKLFVYAIKAAHRLFQIRR